MGAPANLEGGDRSWAYTLLFGSLLLGASAPLFYKLAANLQPVQLAFLVSLVGVFCSGVALAVRPGVAPFAVYAKDRGQLTMLLSWGVGSFTVLVLALSAGTHTLSASLVAIIYRTWPLMLGVLVWPILRERLGKWEWAGLGIGFLGVVGAYAWAGDLLFPSADAGLVIFLFVGAFGDALAAAYSQRYRPKNMLSFIFLCNAIALVSFSILGGWTSLEPGSPVTGTDVVVALFLGGAQNVGLTYLFIRSYGLVSKTGPVALVYLASPFLTFGLDYVFLQEAILPAYWLIAVGVMVGAVVMYLGRGRSERPDRSVPPDSRTV